MPALSIWMNGEHVGLWEVSRTGGHRLFYDPTWLASPHSRPLSLSLPFTPDLEVSGQVVENFFDNLLPDNADIRKRITKRFGLRSTDPNAFALLETIGRDCVGAVQLMPEGEQPIGFNQLKGSPMDEQDVAAHLAGLGNAFGNLEGETDFRLSIAGAQEKTALLRIGEQWFQPLGATPTTHILKPQIGMVPRHDHDFTQSVQNEWLCNQLLGAMGFPVATSTIETFGPHTVLSVERFDRAWNPAGWIARLPQEDLCQAKGVASSQKYEVDGGPGIVECLEVLAGSQESAADSARFVMAQLAFWLLAAIDGHAKNFSIFIQPGGGYQMTPLYDVLSAWPVIGHGHGKIESRRAKMAMAIPGFKSRHYHLYTIQRRHWKVLANFTRITGLWEEMVAMVEGLEAAIAMVSGNLHSSVQPQFAEQIFTGARVQARKFLSGPDE
ncbi:type II toxin-antitoxin system HipA family toxin [Comamonas avium]|uniref:Type II toxin-antitoxin system HipA family toxin n=1 Tax=Comamonas avium TaxID=2762231 RepID=A0ABR8SCU4_9BURK|nr:type II toxin-antitoxin system HipA family toxin [Comamonas avium]MBD7961174.1 type II toxin-antitoxin system HipA family toxin [Comamonas avium]